jgi:hypothetical protein
MRLKSGLWVRAYLHYCQAAGVPAVIARRGDESAGAIFIAIDLLDGSVRLYAPAPAGLEGGETERRWVSSFGAKQVSRGEADVYLGREANFDPDIWVIEVEDKQGRHFLGDAALEE